MADRLPLPQPELTAYPPGACAFFMCNPARGHQPFFMLLFSYWRHLLFSLDFSRRKGKNHVAHATDPSGPYCYFNIPITSLMSTMLR